MKAEDGDVVLSVRIAWKTGGAVTLRSVVGGHAALGGRWME